MIDATLTRDGGHYRITNVRVCHGPPGAPPIIFLTGPQAEGLMIPGDVVWLEYVDGKRERIVCWIRPDDITDYITTRIGWHTE